MIHARDGWHFRRGSNGSVEIFHDLTASPDFTREPDLALSESEWVSIVTVVSWAGDTPGRYDRALAFHTEQVPL